MKKIVLTLTACFVMFQVWSQQAIGTFEQWRNYNVFGNSLTCPQWWTASDSLIIGFGMILNPTGTFVAQVSQETPGRNGSGMAMKVTTRNQDALTGILPAGPMPCLATNSILDVNQTTLDFTFVGGMPFYSVPTSASFWVKNNPLLGDSTEVTIMAIDNSDGEDSIVAIVDTLLGATISNYTQITMPFNVISTLSPNLLRVMVTSSGNGQIDSTAGFTNLHNGTYIIIDDIEITAPNAVVNFNDMREVAKIYPTQTNDIIFVDNTLSEPARIQFRNMRGDLVMDQEVSSGRNSLSIQHFASGNYIFSVFEGKKIIQTGKISKQ
jgi:hypothetical protein